MSEDIKFCIEPYEWVTQEAAKEMILHLRDELQKSKTEAARDFAAKVKAEFQDDKWYRGIEVKTKIKLKEMGT